MAVAYANHTEIIDTDATESITVTVPASLAAGANYVESEGHHPDYPLVCNGLIVPTLQSGTLYLYLKIKTPVT